MILLIIFCVLLLGLAGFLGFRLFKESKKVQNLNRSLEEYSSALLEGQKAIELALRYEDFYNSTIGDIGQIVDALENLVKKRQMLSDDSDVQNLIRLVSIAHDTLLGYIDAKVSREERTEEKGQVTENKRQLL